MKLLLRSLDLTYEGTAGASSISMIYINTLAIMNEAHAETERIFVGCYHELVRRSNVVESILHVMINISFVTASSLLQTPSLKPIILTHKPHFRHSYNNQDIICPSLLNLTSHPSSLHRLQESTIAPCKINRTALITTVAVELLT